MSTFSIFIALILVVCFLLILVVMVQNPKGGGLSSSFGGGAQQMGGVQKTTDFLDRSTWVLATLLLVLILLSNFMISEKDCALDTWRNHSTSHSIRGFASQHRNSRLWGHHHSRRHYQIRPSGNSKRFGLVCYAV